MSLISKPIPSQAVSKQIYPHNCTITMFLYVLLFFVFLFVYWWQSLSEARKDLPPGPTPFPILGNLVQLDPKQPQKTIADWGRKYGPVFTIWIPKANVCITDFKLIKEALVKNGDVYAGRYLGFVFTMYADDAMGNGIILSEGPRWKDQRRFSLHVLRNFGLGRNVMEEKIMEETNRFIDNVREGIGATGQADLDLEIYIDLCVGNIINNLIMGRGFEKGDRSFFELKEMLDAEFREVQSVKMLLLDAHPWLRHLPIAGGFGYKIYWAYARKIQIFLEKQIAEHKKEFNMEDEPKDYCHAYLKEMQRRKESGEDLGYFDETQLRNVLGDLWAAGQETTVTTLRWALVFILRHPEVQKRVQAEIQEVIGDRPVTMADRNLMPYTAAVTQEMQRLGNIFPLNLQHKTTQDTYLGGHLLRKGTTVLPQMSAVHMDPEIFPDPKRFKPERFLEKDGKRLKKVEQLIPFSMGKRMCLGESLARMELFLIFTTFMQKFSITVPKGKSAPTLDPIVGITLVPKKYYCTVTARS